MDSATIGNSDWGMFDPWTQGKSRYIDRDNIGGVLLQGSAFDRTLRWDLARVTLRAVPGPAFRHRPEDCLRQRRELGRAGAIHAGPGLERHADRDVARKDSELDDPNTLNGTGARTRGTTRSSRCRGQYTGLDFMDLGASPITATTTSATTLCAGA